MSRARSILMTKDEICTELGWSDDMVRHLLQSPDASASIRGKYRCDRYNREWVLAVSQTQEARAAKKEWDEMLRGHKPNSGWTTRLGDIGEVLGISAVSVGKILELLGYRSERRVTDSAVAAGCGVRRWDGYALHYDWELDRVVSAIRSAAQNFGNLAVGAVLGAAMVRQERRDRVMARKRKQEETEAEARQEEEAMISALGDELRALRSTDPQMSLLIAVEYITCDPSHRVALYRRCSAEDRSIRSICIGPDDPGLSTITSSVAKDVALLERRARSEGFQV
jgi:hypothetical protein